MCTECLCFTNRVSFMRCVKSVLTDVCVAGLQWGDSECNVKSFGGKTTFF